MAQTDFQGDSNLNAPRILFIGPAESSHSRSWIDLLDPAHFNIRFFALPTGQPPDEWLVRTYLSNLNACLRSDMDPANRLALYGPIRKPSLWQKLLGRLDPRLSMGHQTLMASIMQEWKTARWRVESWEHLLDQNWRQWFGSLGASELPPPFSQNSAPSPEGWLAEIIKFWQPQIIHTFGLEAGGFFFLPVRQKHGLQSQGVWVQQLRGGSDLTLNRRDEKRAGILRDALNQCDWIITDNRRNQEYLAELGVERTRLAPINPVPGTGGVDLDALAALSKQTPAERRNILWPKAYESPWSKSLPVLEALKLCWDRIQPCQVHLLACDEQTRLWFKDLPQEIQRSCQLHDRLPRSHALALTAEARVMLIPSLVDGVPNTLYEAMACGALPIVSPLETISSLVKADENVVMARNLYPDEIADALLRAMNDDALITRLTQNNSRFVSTVADRASISRKVSGFYQSLVA